MSAGFFFQPTGSGSGGSPAVINAARWLFAATNAGAGGAYVTANILSVVNETSSIVDIANEYIVIPATGLYIFGATYSFVSTVFGGGGRIFMGYSINGGSDVTIDNRVMPAATAEAIINGTTGAVSLTAGDILRFRLANTTNTNGIVGTSSFGWIYRVGAS